MRTPGKGLTPSKLQYAIVTQLATDLVNSEEYSSLKDCVAGFNSYHKPVKEISYDKVYRNMREFGIHCQACFCSDTGNSYDRMAFIVVFRAYNSTVVKQYKAPEPKPVTDTENLTPLEVMLREESFIRHSRQAQIQDELAQFASQPQPPAPALDELVSKPGPDNSLPVYTNLYTAYYSKRNHITGQPNAKEYIWPVEAQNVEEATSKAQQELHTGGKHEVFIRRVVVGQ